MSIKPSILIVDDETGIRSLLELSFASAGYDVRTAADGLEALTLCRAESFDAVLSDVRMPGLSGHELARWLAKHRSAARFILMTGWDTGCEDCPIAGRCQIVRKPFVPKDVVATIDRLLAYGQKPAA
jgi:DNA-binding NtrC family response regulator